MGNWENAVGAQGTFSSFPPQSNKARRLSETPPPRPHHFLLGPPPWSLEIPASSLTSSPSLQRGAVSITLLQKAIKSRTAWAARRPSWPDSHVALLLSQQNPTDHVPCARSQMHTALPAFPLPICCSLWLEHPVPFSEPTSSL